MRDAATRQEFALSATLAPDGAAVRHIDSGYRGKEAPRSDNYRGRDTEGRTSMPDKSTPWVPAQAFGPEYDPVPTMQEAPRHLRRVAAGQYESPDGRYEVAYDFYWLEGECECAVCQGYIFAKCPNDGCAKREGWHIWDRQANGGRGDYAIFAHEPQAFETFGGARAALLQAYEAGEA